LKLLFDGLIGDSILSSSFPSPSYPVANLRHSFLKKRYQSSRDVDAVLIEFAAISTVDCFFFGITNASEIQLDLYSDADALLHTEIIEYPESDRVDSVHFTAVAGVAYATVTLTGDSVGVYLGGCDLGEAYTFPDPVAIWPEGWVDNTVTVKSPAGQASFDRVSPFRTYEWDFVNLSRALANELRGKYEAYGRGRPLFIDPFERNHTFMRPYWGTLQEPISTQKDENIYSVKLPTEECF